VESALLRKYSQVFQSNRLGAKACELYAQRRRALLENLSSLCVFAGVDRFPGGEEVWSYSYDRHIQDPAFLYLTGVNQPGAFLALDPQASDPDAREVLFLPAKQSDREFWDGAMLGLAEDAGESLAEMQVLTGFATILPARLFWNWVRERLPKLHRDHVFAFWHEYLDPLSHKLRQTKTDHNWVLHTKLQKVMQRVAPQMELRSVAPLHMHLRIPLDKARVAMAKTAQVWTRDAFTSTLKEFDSFENEREVAAFIEREMRKNGDDGLAFPTIVACANNACTLHYVKSDEPLIEGRLLLLDFGVRCGSLCSDISRTIPVGGRFNPLQRLLYEIVLDTQRNHQANVKPGRTLRELNLQAWDYLEELLRVRFLSKGGHMRREYPRKLVGAVNPNQPLSKGPHGISHLIGEQVHEGDPFRTYQDHPLRPGMMISNEPGLYGHFVAEIGGERYEETIGIRIEDDLLVTAKGCLNLSQGIPKDPAELELLLQH